MNGVDVPQLVLRELASLPIADEGRAGGDRQGKDPSESTEQRGLLKTYDAIIYTSRLRSGFTRPLVQAFSSG